MSTCLRVASNEIEIIIILLEQMWWMTSLSAQRNLLRSRQKSIWDFFICLFFHFPTRCLHFWVNTLNFLLRASTRVLLNDKLLFIQLIHGIFIWNTECKRRVVKATEHFMKIYLGEKCVFVLKRFVLKELLCFMNDIYLCMCSPSPLRCLPKCSSIRGTNIHVFCSHRIRATWFLVQYRAHDVDWEEPFSSKQWNSDENPLV